MARRSPFDRRRAELAKAGVIANVHVDTRRTRAGGAWVLTVKAGDLVVNRDLRARLDDPASAQAEAVTLLTMSTTGRKPT